MNSFDGVFAFNQGLLLIVKNENHKWGNSIFGKTHYDIHLQCTLTAQTAQKTLRAAGS
jgi:hypothetical protein